MSVTWRRETPGQPPLTAGLVVDGARARAWETGGPVVGRFARELTPDEVGSIGVDDADDVLAALHDDLTASPVAALELLVEPPVATLRHVGTEPLPARWDGLVVRVTVHDADSRLVRDERTPVATTVDGEVGPGWSLALADDVPTTPADGFVSVTVGPVVADAVGDGVMAPVELSWSDGWDDVELLEGDG